MKTIIGVSCLSHDAAVAIIKDDRIAFASQAERYSRVKNDKFLNNSLLEDASKYCSTIDKIAFYERPLLKKTRQLFSGQYSKVFTPNSPHKYLKQFPLFQKNPLQYVGHHFSHACAGYFTSPFREAAIVIVDAIGEWETITIWHAKDQKLTKVDSLWYPNSLGLFYSAFTQRVGFKPNEEEYIMMGLAALGKPLYSELLQRELFDFHQSKPFFKMKKNLHRGIKNWHQGLTDIENIAASCQEVLENFLLRVFDWVAKNIPSNNLVYGGGVALNCVFNYKLAKTGLFDDIWILPEPGDAGNSIGSALALRKEWVDWQGPYLGHELGKDLDIDGALSALLAGEIIGVSHGRAEFGPRALGNRSLIADPRGTTVKDQVNVIKKRELFRPFAPVILEDYAKTYFDLPSATSPYMQFVAPCKKPELIPAVCHVDGTSRVQTLTQQQNPQFYQLLKRFHEATQCPLLLNTSLNIKGEPLANTRQDVERFAQLHNVRIF